jgi:hypothetical protein
MILIYSPTITPRLRYITKLIFCDILLSDVQIVDSVAVFKESGHAKLNYSQKQFDNEPFVQASDFLFTSSAELPDLNQIHYKGETGFFETSENSLMPFDPFAAAFLVVSRMEEYGTGTRDLHGRFCANSSLLFRFGLLNKPVVNIWANLLATELQQIYPQLKFPKPVFRLITSIDIDNAWAYRNKGFFRTLASFILDFLKADFKRVGERFRVITGKKKDPYDSYNYLFSLFNTKRQDVIFFFHLGNYARNDKPVSWKNVELRDLIRNIAGKYKVGVHPSYRSGDSGNEELVGIEKERLQVITGLKVELSRQHYLRLQFPETYRRLIAAGIIEDYTMGFHDMAGFRAGICTPYKFYDLEKEQEEPLTIFPFQVMDVTLRQYMKLSPEEAILKVESLIDEVRNVGGTFIGIWHNESVSSANEWKDYLKVFEFMNRQESGNAHE